MNFDDTPQEAEFRATAYLAGVSGLRMLGLFIVLPVLALHAASLPGGGDPAMIGFAIGAYGLAQAVLQIPFGWASDRGGRKPAIAFGLVVSAWYWVPVAFEVSAIHIERAYSPPVLDKVRAGR